MTNSYKMEEVEDIVPEEEFPEEVEESVPEPPPLKRQGNSKLKEKVTCEGCGKSLSLYTYKYSHEHKYRYKHTCKYTCKFEES